MNEYMPYNVHVLKSGTWSMLSWGQHAENKDHLNNSMEMSELHTPSLQCSVDASDQWPYNVRRWFVYFPTAIRLANEIVQIW